MSEFTDDEVMQPAQRIPTLGHREFTDEEVMATPDKAMVQASRSHLMPVLKAFGQGFEEGFGPEQIGTSPETAKWLSDAGIYAPSGAKSYGDAGWRGPFYAFNELAIESMLRTGEYIFRGGSGLFRAGQATVAQIGEEVGAPHLGRDLAAIPEAFFGSPHPIGVPKGAVIRDATRPVKAQEYAGHSGSMELLHGYNSESGFNGFKPLSEVPDEIRYDGGNGVFGNYTYLDPTGRWLKGENGALGYDKAVRVTADFDKLFILTPDTVADLKRVVGDDAAEDAHAVSKGLVEKGYDGIQVKGFDDLKGEARYDLGIDGDMLQDQVVAFNPEKSLKVTGDVPLEGRPDHFDKDHSIDQYWSDVHKTIDLEAARNLGVIGPKDRPTINDGTPADVAARTVENPSEPAAPKPEPNAYDWRARFDQFVGKIQTSDDVRRLIIQSADDNDNFPQARRGELSPAHREDLATAAGVTPDTVDPIGVGKFLGSDKRVEAAMNIMLTTTDHVMSIARDVATEPTDANLIKFQEAIFRRDLAVEEVVGLRGEWGRTGNMFQRYMRDIKDGDALDQFLSGTCSL